MGPYNDLEAVMSFDPEEGLLDLESHLERLRQDAAAQGVAFDRHDARNELQAATFGKRVPVTARLVVARSGAMAIEVTET